MLDNLRYTLRQDGKYIAASALISLAHLLAGPLTIVVCIELGCWTTRKLVAAARAARHVLNKTG